ncbi:MAG TPA: amidohydrolase family protein [Stellaceae bacterium]|nr:amidohydrolase family protein [Stellaceae bacterium]
MSHSHRVPCSCVRPPRRLVLGGLAGAAAALSGVKARAGDAVDPAPRRVDVHHHFFPPAYLDKIEDVVGNKPSPLMTGWSAAGVLDHMDKTGVATAILSMSPWGPHFKDAAQAKALARACNEYAAQTSRDHPGRFGLFAAMPLPDIDGALAEITYAFDTLKADGVGLMTNYGAKWPGDPAFAPVWEELNRRKAVAYFHPNTPECCGHLVPGAQPSMLEWPYDTGRTVVSLLLGGALVKYPDVKWIFSHAGGPHRQHDPQPQGPAADRTARGHARTDPAALRHRECQLCADAGGAVQIRPGEPGAVRQRLSVLLARRKCRPARRLPADPS